MTKPRDKNGNDLIVGCTGLAIQIAHSAGLQNDNDFVKKLANGFYHKELERLRCPEQLA